MNPISALNEKQRQLLLSVSALVVVIAISLFIFLLRDRATEIAIYGYPGIFLFSVLSNATVILPAPGIALVFALGGVLNPGWVAVAAGAGATVGELSGYLAGISGQAVIQNADIYQRVVGWMEKNNFLGYLIVMVLALVPNPLFDLAGIAAGALRLPVIQFMLWAFIGKTVKMFIIAYAGDSSINWLFPG